MKSKKILVLLSSLALLLGACNGNKGSSKSEQKSEPAQSSQSAPEEIAVTALALNKETLSLEAGKSETLSVTVTPENASNTKVSWETSDAAIAEVSSLGKVTAKAVGTATITVKSQSNPDVKAECVVTVTEEGGAYGSLNKPKTVAEALAIAEEECKEDGDVSKDKVYVKGLVTKNPTYNAEKGFSQNVYLKDSATAEKELLVYSVNHDALKVPYQNDEVVLHGYVKNYKGTLEIASVTIDGASVYPEIDVVTRGNSTITYNVENGAVNAEAPTSAKNNTEFSFSVTPEQGYKVDRVAVNGDAVEADASGAYKAIVKGNTTVNIDISPEGVTIKTAIMAYPGGDSDSDTKNMVEGNNAAEVGLDPSVFEVVSTNTTGLYAGLNKSAEIRLYDNRKATDTTQIANGTTLTVSSRKVTITKIVIELTSASTGTMEVKAGNTVVTGNEGTYQINNAQFSIQNVSEIAGGASASGKQVVIKKVTISYSENAEVAATAIAVSPKTLTLKPEETSVLAVAFTPVTATDTVSWKSSDDTKATVDQTGRVTAVAQGSATITAFIDADGDGAVDENEIKDTAAVTIEAAEVINYGSAEHPLTVAEAKAVLDKTGSNESKQPLFVKGIISTNKAFSTQFHNGEVWLQSDDGTVAQAFEAYSCEIDASLNYAGDPAADDLKGYEVIITGYGKIYSSTYELTNVTRDNVRINPKIISMTREEVAATAVALDQKTAEVAIGSTVKLTATLTPAEATSKVSWKSSDTAIATVANGTVTGVGAGSATITAFVDLDGSGDVNGEEPNDVCTVTVPAPTVDGVQYVISVSDEAWPTTAEEAATEHTIGNVAVKTCGLNKDTSGNAQEGGDIFMKKGAGYIYNTTSLGKILSIKVTFSANSSAGKYANIVLGASAIDARNTDSANAVTFAKSQTIEVTNDTDGVGFFNVSNNQGTGKNDKNIRIVSIVIICAK